MHVNFYFYEACRFDELSRGSFSCLDLKQLLLVKKYDNRKLKVSCVLCFRHAAADDDNHGVRRADAA